MIYKRHYSFLPYFLLKFILSHWCACLAVEYVLFSTDLFVHTLLICFVSRETIVEFVQCW